MSTSRSPSPPQTLRGYLSALARLSRAQMTVITGATHLAASLTTRGSLNTSVFLCVWAFIILAQLTTHFLGEVYDVHSDRLNRHATVLTGGSRVLLRTLPPSHARIAAAVAATAASLALFLVPSHLRLLAAFILFLATQYSAPPFLFNHCACGELDAALITSVLVPVLSAAAQPAPHVPHLLLLVLPSACAKIALFLVLNQADRRADWTAGKYTLPAVLGDVATARLHRVCMAACYLAILVIGIHATSIRDLPTALTAVSMLATGPSALRIIRQLQPMPYRLDSVVPLTLLHSSGLIWAFLLPALVFRLPRDGLLNLPIVVAAGLATVTLRTFRKRPASRVQDEEQAASHPTPDNGHPDAAPLSARPTLTARDADGAVVSCDVTIVGAGVAGLVAGVALHRLGISVVVLERRDSPQHADTGADLALWPGAIAILKALGVPEHFFTLQCFPLDRVHMTNMDFSSGEAEILNTIDMAAVTNGTGERFVLVPRQRLMAALRDVVPDGLVVYDANVTSIEEREEQDQVRMTYTTSDGDMQTRCITSRIAIGADGARSCVRKHVLASTRAVAASLCFPCAPLSIGSRDDDEDIRYCGEVCYRGVLSLDKLRVETRARMEELFQDAASERTMRINYGAGLRSSFGYMTGDGSVAYWWVKQVSPKVVSGRLKDCKWPEPLRSLHDLTPDEGFYVHAVEDSRGLRRWCTARTVVIGDAAHVVTPNMGQGACLAVEDAFVLAIELRRFWKWADGHLEGFYRYERCRKGFAERVAAEARSQLLIGQLKMRGLVRLREFMLRNVPASVLQKTLRRNNFGVADYIDAFRKSDETQRNRQREDL